MCLLERAQLVSSRPPPARQHRPFASLLFGCPSRLRSREIEEEEEKRVAHRVVVWIKRLVESREKSFCRGVSSSQTMAPPPPRSDRGDREVPTSTKNTTSKTSSDEGSNDRRAEKRYEERGLVFGVVVVTSPRGREMMMDDTRRFIFP